MYLGKVLLVTLQLRWRVLNGHEQNLHGWKAGKWCMTVCHLQDGDAKGPDVSQLIVPEQSSSSFLSHTKLTPSLAQTKGNMLSGPGANRCETDNGLFSKTSMIEEVDVLLRIDNTSGSKRCTVLKQVGQGNNGRKKAGKGVHYHPMLHDPAACSH